jgi:hypothetical protein
LGHCCGILSPQNPCRNYPKAATHRSTSLTTITTARSSSMTPEPADTKYLGIGVRIKVFNPADPAEIALVNQLQDQFVIAASSADSLPPLTWDVASLQELTKQYERDGAQYSSWKGMMGPRGKVDESTRHIAAAAAWGLFPEWDATYLNYSGNHDPQIAHKATYEVPDNNAFWSITVYGGDGFMKNENCIVNSSNVTLNDDGTFTVWFGSKELCGDVPNRIDVTEGWNFPDADLPARPVGVGRHLHPAERGTRYPLKNPSLRAAKRR